MCQHNESKFGNWLSPVFRFLFLKYIQISAYLVSVSFAYLTNLKQYDTKHLHNKLEKFVVIFFCPIHLWCQVLAFDLLLLTSGRRSEYGSLLHLDYLGTNTRMLFVNFSSDRSQYKTIFVPTDHKHLCYNLLNCTTVSTEVPLGCSWK